MDRKLKDPNAILDYGLDWKDAADPWLKPDEEIVTSTWFVPTGITKDSESNTATVAIVWLSGGTLGAKHTVVNRITTNQGRTDERSLEIVVRER